MRTRLMLALALLAAWTARPADEHQEPGAQVKVTRLDTWLPILDARGHQRKAIVAGTDEALADGERPIVLDRDRDYAIDYAGGRLKALAAGRIEPGWSVSLSFRYTDAGPQPIELDGRQGYALDGLDDYVPVNWRPAVRGPWPKVTLSCRVELAEDAAAGAFIWGDPNRFGLELTEGRLTLRAGREPPLTAPEALPRGRWIEITGVLADGTLTLTVDGKAVATRPAPELTIRSPLRLQVGGKIDPAFLHARVLAPLCEAGP